MFIASCVRITNCILVLFTSLTTVGAQPNAQKPFRPKAAVPNETITDSAARHKVDSRLLEAIAQYKNGNKASNTSLEPVDVGIDSIGNLSVDISAAVSDSLLHTITALGGKVIYPSEKYHIVRAVINLSVVKTLAMRKDVTFVQPAGQAQNNTVAPLRRLN